MRFNLRFSRVFVVLVLLIFCCLPLRGQYATFYVKQRGLEFYSIYPAYKGIIDAYNKSKNIPETILRLDSLASEARLTSSHEYLFLKNEVANFYKFNNQMNEGAGDLHRAMNWFAAKEDTMHIEYAVSLRMLRTILFRSNLSNLRTERSLFESNLAILKALKIEGEPMTNLLVDYGLYLNRTGEDKAGMELLYQARGIALREGDFLSLAIADYSLLSKLRRNDLQQTVLEVLKNDLSLIEERPKSIPLLNYSVYFNYVVGQRYYEDFSDIDKGIEYTKKAIACLDTLQYPSWNIMASCHSQLSLYYSELGDYGLFNDHYQKARMIAQEKPMSAYNKTLAYVNIAEAVLRFSPDSCLALVGQIKAQPGYVNFVFPVASMEAKALMQLGKYLEAISIVNDLFDQKDDFKGYQIPVINVDDDLVGQAHLLGLIDESYRKLGLLNGNKDYIEMIGLLIDRQNNAFLKLMETDVYGQEIVSAVSDYHRFVVSAIDFLLEHNASGCFNKDLIKLFTTSKALQLTGNIVKSSIQSGLESDTAGFAIIMQNVEEGQRIKNELNRKDLDAVAQQELKTSLNSLLIDYLMLRFRLGDKASLPSLALEIPDQGQLQALLAEDEGIVEYIQADSMLYWFFISKDQVRIGKRASPDLDKLIDQQIYACKTGSDFDGLEMVLFGDVEESLKNIKRLHIIPDKKLSLFPFEMLSMPGSGKRLVERFDVSYSYSNALWYMNKVLKQEGPADGVLVIAPVFESRKEQQNDAFIAYRGHEDLFPLLESGAEADNIRVLGLKYKRGVNVLKGKDATENNVRAYLGKHGIIHFATHGLVNKESDERSGLFLSDVQAGEGQNNPYDGFMSQGELYHLKLNANLVVLSACNTGVGSVWEGEGVLSLPRGFIYAGVPNVIASLWRVNDKKTREFMSMFYEYVFQGESYSKALQKTKLECINKAWLPIDWAAFVLIGQ